MKAEELANLLENVREEFVSLGYVLEKLDNCPQRYFLASVGVHKLVRADVVRLLRS
jgi:hypothetical protein